MDTTAEKAIDRYRNDARFGAICLSATHEAVSGLDQFQVSEERELIFDIALKAATLTMERIIAGDAELNAMRVERDFYKENALRLAHLTPVSGIVIPAALQQPVKEE